jgi:hypothetical protein
MSISHSGTNHAPLTRRPFSHSANKKGMPGIGRKAKLIKNTVDEQNCSVASRMKAEKHGSEVWQAECWRGKVKNEIRGVCQGKGRSIIEV